MVFIELGKAHDRIPREVIPYVLEKQHVYKPYIDAIKKCTTVTSVEP